MKELKMGMRPPHPGEILREDYIKPLGLTVTAAAKGLGTTRVNLSAILNEKTGIAPVMAIKLAEAFETTPQLWLGLQQQYDLYYAEKKVKRSSIRHFRTTTEGLTPSTGFL